MPLPVPVFLQLRIPFTVLFSFFKKSFNFFHRSFLDDWIFEEGEYIGISLINLPYLGSDSMLSPKSRADDGVLHLMLVRYGISKKNLLQMLMVISIGSCVWKNPTLG